MNDLLRLETVASTPSRRGHRARTPSPGAAPVLVPLLGLLLLTASACTDRPPVLDPIQNQVVEMGGTFDFTATAEDPEGEAVVFFAERLPEGASFDAGSGRLTWTPGIDYARDFVITVGVRDTGDLVQEDTQNVMLSVVAPGSRDDFGTLRAELRDAATGKARAARVQLKGSDGRYYGPRVGILHCGPGGNGYFYASGAFEADLPPGPAEVVVAAGTEYTVLTQTASVPAGNVLETSYALERWTHMAESGWYSGDVHIHANYGLDFIPGIAPQIRPENSVEDVALMVRGEDLNVANLLVSNSLSDRLFDSDKFEGRLNAASTDRHLLYWNQEFRSAIFGHLTLLDLRNLVFPSNTGYDVSANPYDYPPNAVAADLTHEQNGTVIYAHPAFVEDDFASLIPTAARELAVDLALGKVDAMEIMSYASSEERSRDLWYHVLNCGYRIPAVAGTDSFCNFVQKPFCHGPLGGNRVYVKTDAGLSYEAWIAGLRAGKSFVTNGPMLSLLVNGKAPGSEIVAPNPGPYAIVVHAEAQSVFPMDRLEIVQNGQVVHTQPAGGSPLSIVVDVPLVVTESCWVAARVDGSAYSPFLFDSPLFALTNPVYVDIGGQPIDSVEDRAFFLQQIDKLARIVEIRDRFASLQDKNSFFDLLGQAEQIHQGAINRLTLH